MNTYTENKPKSLWTSTQETIKATRSKLWKQWTTLMFEKGVFIYIIGFLLGRAVILSTLSPFVIAFVAAVWFLRRDKVFPLLIFAMLGALTYSLPHSMYILLALSVFFVVSLFIQQAKALERILPFVVFAAASIPRMTIYSMNVPITYIEWIIALVEGLLATVLFLIFMQSMPLLSPKRYKPILKNEEIVCFIILIASIMTGVIGVELYQAHMEQVLTRYLVLLLALVGGAAIGSTVGVVAGLILSLANIANVFQMSLLAFSGLLGGLLKEGRKIGVSIGLLISTLLVSLYSGAAEYLSIALWESALAIILLFLTPNKLIKQLAKYIPGTIEHSREQEQYLQKVRNVTAHRVERFSNVFKALSHSFQTTSHQWQEHDVEVDYYLSNVTEKTCQTCFKKETCWVQHFDKTYNLMKDVKDQLEADKQLNSITNRQFENHCIKSRKVMDTMQQELSFFQANQQLKKQVLESRRFVADQLQGVSDFMKNFAGEIMKEKENHEQQELEIVAALKHVGIELEKLDIYSLEQGNIDVEMVITFQQYHGEAAKLIAPILSDILDETVIPVTEDISPLVKGHSFFTFGSARKYDIKTGVAHAAKGGGLVSGDCYKAMDLGAGKFALAISDGMGNGDRAHEESTETLRLLQQILESGFHEQVAIKSINSILALRTDDEIYATLDLAMIDLHHALVQFLKVGSTPSFILRHDQVEKVEASNLPIGIIQEVDVDVVSAQLQAGDFLVMMSDGILEGPKHIDNVDEWMEQKLLDMETSDPQEMADILLEEVVRTQGGEIGDDMTVLVAEIKENHPEWAPIRSFRHFQRENIS
ncbi:stage II sporulation protein E [Gracilibacillus alcaliphilus]|uniref:stage II sporulation protein E n=1 Tax=Gracilibacillus alcaliphilus TaxID=1401441 RepID=UPI0019587D18|nr:stage II sporulation protein E [Gracilibacillus alcaliphilus]MBM7678145.1 stage II sporulation protein E [Gracilibacillus alcaliphilus]